MHRFDSAVLLVLIAYAALSAGGCTVLDSPGIAASGDHDGLALNTSLRATRDSLVVETSLRNTRSDAVHLDASQCGRVTEVILARTFFQPEGATYTGSLDGLKRLILRQQRSYQSPNSFAPRVVTGGSDVPDCVRPTRPVDIAPGGSIAEKWELEFTGAYALAELGSGQTVVRATAVESIAADKLGFIDILAPDEADEARAGRAVVVETPASSVLDRPPTRPHTGPSLGEQFDQMLETAALRDFIEAQPVDSWRDANIISGYVGGDRFRAVTTAYERPLTALLAPDGSLIGDPGLPAEADRTRIFERRPATLPPGIAIIPEPETPVLTEDVIAGLLTLPTGRVVAPGLTGDEVPLTDVAAPGAYPIFATVAGEPGSPFGRVAFASLVVSDAPTVEWKARSTVGVDGGTSGFTSAEVSELLAGMDPDAQEDVIDVAFNSLTAHDNMITAIPIGDDLDMAIFSTGYGDGGYGVYVGLDADGKPTRYVMDFAIVHLGWP